MAPLAEAKHRRSLWLADRFGSRKGLALTYWHQLLYALGKYKDFRQVEWQSVERLVFVCKGNICRSAYAEAVARALGIEAISCGLDTVEDAPANQDAIEIAREKGVDLGTHKTRPIMYMLLRKSDLLIAMEPWQADFLKIHLSKNHQYTLMGSWSKPSLPYIHDPYGSSPAYFESCFDYIETSVHEIVNRIKSARRDGY